MIGIKHMEMPKCCDDCRFMVDEPEIEEYDFLAMRYCGASDFILNRVNTSEERHPHCPLVEIRGDKE